MRQLSFISGTLAFAVMALIAACDNPTSRLPTTPSAPSASTVAISGPDSVAPGQSAQFIALVSLSDGTRKTATNVQWRSSNTSLLQVNPSGVATAGQQRGETTLTAELTVPGVGVRQSTREVVILPGGTVRIVGVVSEADFPTSPVAGARVEVTPGSLVATTDLSGQYRLYGVPLEAEVRVTRDGYQPFEQSLRLTGHATQNFRLTVSGTRLSLAGNYTLTIDGVGLCSSSGGLTADLQRRSYDAVLTQNGWAVEVVLTESRFRLNSEGRGNRFSGRVDAAGATFTLEPYDASWYPYYQGPADYPDVAERLPNGTVLVPEGTAVTTGSAAAGLSGQINGGISNWNSAFPTNNSHFLGGCGARFGSLRFTLTPR